MNSTARNWLQRKVAIVNGVTESSGVVHAIEPIDSPRLLPVKLNQKSVCNEDVFGDLSCTHAIILSETSNSEHEITVFVGECGMGADGFVAVEELNTKNLRWIAFFDFSNPFHSVAIEKNLILATNNLNEEWQFAIESPWEIKIVTASRNIW